MAAIINTSCEKLLPVGMASPGCSAIGSGPSATSDPKNPLDIYAQLYLDEQPKLATKLS